MLVVDEAHYVKNPDAQRVPAVASCGRPTRSGRCSSPARRWRTGSRSSATSSATCSPASPPASTRPTASPAPRRFRRAVATVYLRRNQDDVLTELPDKIEVEDWVQFTGRRRSRLRGDRAVAATSCRCAGPRYRSSRLGQARPARRDRGRGPRGRPQGRGVLLLPRRARHDPDRRSEPRRSAHSPARCRPLARQQLDRRVHAPRRPRGAAQPDRGRRRRPEHPGRLRGDHRRTAVEAEHRGAGDRPRLPHGPDPQGPGAPPAGQGQRRRAPTRDPRTQEPAVRRVRPQERRQGSRPRERSTPASTDRPSSTTTPYRWSGASFSPSSTGSASALEPRRGNAVVAARETTLQELLEGSGDRRTTSAHNPVDPAVRDPGLPRQAGEPATSRSDRPAVPDQQVGTGHPAAEARADAGRSPCLSGLQLSAGPAPTASGRRTGTSSRSSPARTTPTTRTTSSDSKTR